MMSYSFVSTRHFQTSRTQIAKDFSHATVLHLSPQTKFGAGFNIVIILFVQFSMNNEAVNEIKVF
jgi:hypothetical protein